MSPRYSCAIACLGLRVSWSTSYHYMFPLSIRAPIETILTLALRKPPPCQLLRLTHDTDSNATTTSTGTTEGNINATVAPLHYIDRGTDADIVLDGEAYSFSAIDSSAVSDHCTDSLIPQPNALACIHCTSHPATATTITTTTTSHLDELDDAEYDQPLFPGCLVPMLPPEIWFMIFEQLVEISAAELRDTAPSTSTITTASTSTADTATGPDELAAAVPPDLLGAADNDNDTHANDSSTTAPANSSGTTTLDDVPPSVAPAVEASTECTAHDPATLMTTMPPTHVLYAPTLPVAVTATSTVTATMTATATTTTTTSQPSPLSTTPPATLLYQAESAAIEKPASELDVSVEALTRDSFE